MSDKFTEKGHQVKREELIASFSRHSNLTNKYMLGILLVTTIFLMNLSPSKKIDFPFIGEIAVEYYYYISIAFLGCLILLFSSSHMMTLRIREYYNRYFDSLNDKDYIDLTVEPTIFRMAPIAWMIKNKGVFYINYDEVNSNWKSFELTVYFFLKGLIFIIVYLLPTFVFIIMLIKSDIFLLCMDFKVVLKLFLIILSISSIISFAVVWKNEIGAVLSMPRKINKKYK